MIKKVDVKEAMFMAIGTKITKTVHARDLRRDFYKEFLLGENAGLRFDMTTAYAVFGLTVCVVVRCDLSPFVSLPPLIAATLCNLKTVAHPYTAVLLGSKDVKPDVEIRQDFNDAARKILTEPEACLVRWHEHYGSFIDATANTLELSAPEMNDMKCKAYAKGLARTSVLPAVIRGTHRLLTRCGR